MSWSAECVLKCKLRTDGALPVDFRALIVVYIFNLLVTAVGILRMRKQRLREAFMESHESKLWISYYYCCFLTKQHFYKIIFSFYVNMPTVHVIKQN